MDLNRVKFLLRAYLRVRLAKARAWPLHGASLWLSLTQRPAARQIEEHVLYTIKDTQLLSRLSLQEQEFAKGCGLSPLQRASLALLTLHALRAAATPTRWSGTFERAC